MDELIVLVGYGFDQNGPYLELDKYSTNQIHRFKSPLTDRTFSLIAQDNRYCTGSFDLEILEGSPCKDQTELANSSNTTCYPCFEKTGFNPSFYHMQKSEISTQQRAYNNTPHVVYLAYFSEGLIKVGISSDRRKNVRWVEQGARSVAHIMTCKNAYEARHNEELISKQLHLPEVVLGKKKRAILNFFEGELNAQKILESLIGRIQSELNFALSNDRIYHFDHTYNPNSIQLNSTIIDLSEEKKKISGKFIGLYGDILIVENDKKQFMHALKKMIGHQVNMNDQIERLDFQPQQVTLF